MTSYYCCLNAAKALLAIRGRNDIDFDNLSHGITSDRRQWTDNNIKNAEVIFQGAGVLFELSKHFGEEANKKIYHVYDLLYNIPCIHRTFAITYNCTELFIPVKQVNFVVNSKLRKGWIQCVIDERYSSGNALRWLPKQYEVIQSEDDKHTLVREKRRFDWDIHTDIKQRSITLSKYHGKVRKNLHYITGDSRLWYIKKAIPSNQHIIDRHSITLIFATMHWLSELVRYNPEKFSKLMKTKQNWILHEIVENALYQYIDEISCEMTSVDIMSTGYRK